MNHIQSYIHTYIHTYIQCQDHQTGGQRTNTGNNGRSNNRANTGNNAGSNNNQTNRGRGKSYADIARDRQKGPQHTTKYNGQSSAAQIRRSRNNNFLDNRPQQGRRWRNQQLGK